MEVKKKTIRPANPEEKPTPRPKAGATSKKQARTLIGWSEYIDLPDWGIKDLKAKVDTGARTSALHVEDLVVRPDGHVEFHVILDRKVRRRRHVRAPIVKWAKVRSSTGVYRTRCFVAARMRLGDIDKVIELSLVSREKMLFRMLIGRKALEHDFLIDVGKRSVHGKPKKTKKLKKAKAAKRKPL